MHATTNAFIQALDQRGTKYTTRTMDNGKDLVKVVYRGENADSITVNLVFNADCEDVAVRSFSICKIPETKIPAIMLKLNDLNARFRWLKFYMDSDNEITAEMDAVITPVTAGPVCVELMLRSVNIIDDAYPELMKALWS